MYFFLVCIHKRAQRAASFVLEYLTVNKPIQLRGFFSSESFQISAQEAVVVVLERLYLLNTAIPRALLLFIQHQFVRVCFSSLLNRFSHSVASVIKRRSLRAVLGMQISNNRCFHPVSLGWWITHERIFKYLHEILLVRC